MKIWWNDEYYDGLRFVKIILNDEGDLSRIGFFCPAVHEHYQEGVGWLLKHWSQPWPQRTDSAALRQTAEFVLAQLFYGWEGESTYGTSVMRPEYWTGEYIPPIPQEA